MAKAPAKKEKSPPPPAEEEAGQGGREAEEKAAPQKGGRLKLILIIAGAMVVSAGLAFFAAVTFMGPSPEAAPPAAESPEGGEPEASETPAPAAPQRASGGHGEAAPEGGGEGEGGEEAVPAGPTNIELKPFIVNLGDVGGKRLLKLTMSIEADTQELADEINLKMPQFKDEILLLLSSLNYDDVATLDGKQRLKNQMLSRVNRALTKGKVRNIYFSEMVVQ